MGLPNNNCCVVGQLYYPIAKTLAEKAGWEFAKETGFDVVMINPGTALGPLLPPRINSSMAVLVSVLKGNKIRHILPTFNNFLKYPTNILPDYHIRVVYLLGV